MDYRPDGRRLASASYPFDKAEAEVKLRDVSDGRELLTLPATGRGSLAFGADGHRLSYVSAVGGRRDAGVQAGDATPMPDDRPGATPGPETGRGRFERPAPPRQGRTRT